jgi:hypothetical protein
MGDSSSEPWVVEVADQSVHVRCIEVADLIFYHPLVPSNGGV